MLLFCDLKDPPQFEFFVRLVSDLFREKSNVSSVDYDILACLYNLFTYFR